LETVGTEETSEKAAKTDTTAKRSGRIESIQNISSFSIVNT